MTSLGNTRKSSASRRVFGVGCQLIQNCAYVMVSGGSRPPLGNRVIKANPEPTGTVGQVISDLPSNFLFLNSTVSKTYRTSQEM